MTIAAATTASTTASATFAGTPGDVPRIDALAINTIRTLSMDAVQAANSGHPGTPMALAPVGYALWQNVLKFDPRGSAVAQSRSLCVEQWPRMHVDLQFAAFVAHARSG